MKIKVYLFNNIFDIIILKTNIYLSMVSSELMVHYEV